MKCTIDTRNLTSNNKPHQLNMHILLKTNKHAKQAGQVVCRRILDYLVIMDYIEL